MIIAQSLKKHSSLPNWYAIKKLSEDDNKNIFKWCASYHTYNWILIIIILLYDVIASILLFIGVFESTSHIIQLIIKHAIGYLTIWILYVILSNINAPQVFYVNEKMYTIFQKIPQGKWLLFIMWILTSIIVCVYLELINKYKLNINYIIYFIFLACPLIVFICFEIYIRYRLKQCEKMFDNKDTDTIMIEQDGVVAANNIAKHK